MELVFRIIGTVIEVGILIVMAYCVLNGARLTAFDLGLNVKYRRAIGMVLLIVGTVISVFFISHLTLFYPPG